DGASIAIRRLTALVRETGELRLYVIEKVRAAPAVQVAPSSLQMMLVGQIEVESHRRASVDAEARWIVAVSLQVRIGQLRAAAGCSGGAANVGQQFPDHRINRRSLTVCGRQSEQVDLPDLARHVVLENASLGQRIKDRPLPADLAGLPGLFVVDEEESFVAAI